MNPEHLPTFLVVAETLHFGQAAERLGITQSTLSRRIERLEADLGVRLFDRGGLAPIALTPAGEALRSSAPQILSTIERATFEVWDAASGRVGPLRLGFVGSVGYRVLPNLLRQYRDSYPGHKLDLREMTTTEQQHAIASGELDAGITRPPLELDGFASQIIWREPLIAALPANHPLITGPTIDLAELASELFILPPRDEGPGYNDLITAACLRAGFRPSIEQEATQLSTAVGLVAAGLGVTLVPESVRDFRLAGVEFVELEPPEITIELALIWIEGHTSPALSHLIEVSAWPGQSTENS